MKKPIIGIVSRPFNTNNGLIFGTVQTYQKAITKFGGIPITILPTNIGDYSKLPSDICSMNNVEKNNLEEVLKLCDGILMPGGSEIYEYDNFICRYALDNKIPLLGICLGMQIMATSHNNNDLELNSKITKKDHMKLDENYVHSVNIILKSNLFNIVKKKQIMVNSRHNYHVICNSSFNISSYSDDGLIESIEIPNKEYNIGVQWHPERMIDYDEDSGIIIKSFVEASASKHN